MALVRPVHVGVTNIMEAFDNLSRTGDQVFAVWYGANDIAFQCTIDDPALQRDMLERNLQALEASGNTDLLHLKMYPAGQYNFIDGKSKPVSNTPIQVCEFQLPKVGADGGNPDLPANRPPGMSWEAWSLLHKLEDMPNTIEARINAAVEAKLTEIFGDQEEEPEIDPMEKTMGYINGLTQNPVIMELIGKALQFFNRPQAQPGPIYPQPTIGMAENRQNHPHQKSGYHSMKTQ